MRLGVDVAARGGQAVMMAHLMLTEDEVNPVMSVLLANGLDVTALHNQRGTTRRAKASYARVSAEIAYDPSRTRPQAIAKAITNRSGFEGEVVERPPCRSPT